MFRHVIWDFDGTLFDTYPVMAEVFQRILAEEGHLAPISEITRHMTVSMGDALAFYGEKFGVGGDFREKFAAASLDAQLRDAKPFDGAAKLCGDIQSRGGFNYLYTHRGDSAIELLKINGMLPFFTDFVVRRHGFERKPSPAAINFLIEKHGIPRGDAIMIGDRAIDVLAAKNAGINACLFAETPQKTVADFTAKDFTELRLILLQREASGNED